MSEVSIASLPPYRLPPRPALLDTSDTDKTLELPRSRAVATSPDASLEIRAEDILDEEPARCATSSVAPTSMDVTLPPLPRLLPMRADASLELASEMVALPRRRLGGMVAAVMVCAGAILGAAMVRLAWPADANATATATVRAPTPVAAAVVATATSAAAALPAPAPSPVAPRAKLAPNQDVPLVDVSSLPRAPLGTIVTTSRGALIVDGAYVAGRSVVVKCGKHTARVGWRGRTKTVEVPCSGEVSVF